MRLEVIGREIRSYVDKETKEEKERVALYCVGDPSRKDKGTVTGRITFEFSLYKGNGLLPDVKALDIPCVINADISRNGRFLNLEDFELVE